MPSEARLRNIFVVAGLWNLFWGIPLLLVPSMAMTNIGLAEPSQGVGELHARAGGLAVVLFGWIYMTIGRDLAAFRPFLRIAIVAKLLFFLVVAYVYVRNRELLPMLVIALGDLAFGGLFVYAWHRNR